MRPRRLASSIAVVFTLIVARSAHAQSAGADAAALFEQGRAALAQKDYATACPKFEESLRLERAVGTLISLAQCEDATNKLASARQHWKEAADLATATHDRLDRAPYAAKKLAEIEPRVPRLVLVVPAGAPRDLRISRDGVDLGRDALDNVFVDPGPHTLRVTASGRVARVIDIVVAEGEKKTLSVEPGPEDKGTVVGSAAAKGGGESPATSPESERGSGLRTVGWIAVGVGAATIVVGGVTGLMASSAWSDAKDACGSGCAPDSAAEGRKSDAEGLATISTVTFIAGSVVAVAGAVLVLTAPSGPAASSTNARIRLSPTGVYGTW